MAEVGGGTGSIEAHMGLVSLPRPGRIGEAKLKEVKGSKKCRIWA